MSKLAERESAPASAPVATAPALAVQFFLIPLAVVGMVVLVYGGFRFLVTDQRTPEEYLNDVRTGGRDRRWPAAYELSRLLANPDVEVEHPSLGSSLVQAFEDSQGDDQRVRRYLALAIGQLNSPPADAVERLVVGLSDPDAETVISVIWALASLNASSVGPEIEAAYSSEDDGVRKMAVYALGALPSASGLAVLQRALEDPVPDVQWNAAVALARHGNPDGETVLGRMLNRDYVAQHVTRAAAVDAAMDPVSEVMVSGLQAVAALQSPSLRDQVETLSQADESLRVREVAIRTLKALNQPTPEAEGRVSPRVTYVRRHEAITDMGSTGRRG